MRRCRCRGGGAADGHAGVSRGGGGGASAARVLAAWRYVNEGERAWVHGGGCAAGRARLLLLMLAAAPPGSLVLRTARECAEGLDVRDRGMGGWKGLSRGWMGSFCKVVCFVDSRDVKGYIGAEVCKDSRMDSREDMYSSFNISYLLGS